MNCSGVSRKAKAVVMEGVGYDVVGRVQEVGDDGGLDADTADVRPHCWHCRGKVRGFFFVWFELGFRV
jgi:hypothetical protein